MWSAMPGLLDALTVRSNFYGDTSSLYAPLGAQIRPSGTENSRSAGRDQRESKIVIISRASPEAGITRWGGLGLIGIVALIAAVVLLVTGRYPGADLRLRARPEPVGAAGGAATPG